MFVTVKPESPADIGELATSLAVLVLHDSGKDVTAENINAVTAAAGISGINALFAAAFSSAVAGHSLEKLLAGPKPGAGAATGGAAPTSSSSTAAPVEEKVVKPESEEDLGQGGLFGDDDAAADY